MNVAQAMPYLDKPFNVSKDSFDAIFGSAKLMYIASMCAYLVGKYTIPREYDPLLDAMNIITDKTLMRARLTFACTF